MGPFGGARTIVPSGTCTSTVAQQWTERLSRPLAQVKEAFTPVAMHGTDALGLAGPGGGPYAVAVVGIQRGHIETLRKIGANGGGLWAGALTADWGVWTQMDTNTSDGKWRLVAWNRRTGQIDELAADHGDQASGQAAPPTPLIHGSTVIFVDKLPGQRLVALTAIDMTTHARRVLTTGIVVASAVTGDTLVWVERQDRGEVFRAYDLRSANPLAVPDDLAPGDVSSVAISSDWLMWVTAGGTRLDAWDLHGGKRYEYAADVATGPFQFLEIWGEYVNYYTGDAQIGMNARTGASLTWPHSGVNLQGGRITVIKISQNSTLSTISQAQLSALPPLGECPPTASSGTSPSPTTRPLSPPSPNPPNGQTPGRLAPRGA